jgi:hypothetical protein
MCDMFTIHTKQQIGLQFYFNISVLCCLCINLQRPVFADVITHSKMSIEIYFVYSGFGPVV